MIDIDRKFIFVHIPKTGGTSIESVLRMDMSSQDVPFKHMNIMQYMDRFDLNGLFKFSIVRNPWDITVSMYKYMWQSNYDWPKKWRSKTNQDLLNLKFRDWVSHETFQFPSLRSVDLLRNIIKSEPDQFAWVSRDGELLVDYICKFETLQEDFNIVCEKLGVKKKKLPHINKSTRDTDYLKYYDEHTYDIVKKKYSRDIDAFDYINTTI